MSISSYFIKYTMQKYFDTFNECVSYKNTSFPDNLLWIQYQTRLSLVTLLLTLFRCLNGRVNWELFPFNTDLFIHLQGTTDLIFFLASGGDELFVLMFSCEDVTCFMQYIQCFLTCSLVAAKMRWLPTAASLNPTRKAAWPEENSFIFTSLSRVIFEELILSWSRNSLHFWNPRFITMFQEFTSLKYFEPPESSPHLHTIFL